MVQLGDWVVGEPVGHGANSVVHEGHHRLHVDRVVAIKRRSGTTGAPGPDEIAVLVREARVLRQLSHPAIMPFVDVVPDDDGVALVMDLAQGSLSARIEAEGALAWQDVADLGSRIGSGLAAAHGAGIIHRDVTPGNILYGRELEPRLADFGASLMGQDDHRVVGTPGYLDPAVADGGQPGPLSDVYGLGIVLYEALAGQPPWAGGTPQAVMRAADRGVHLPLSDLAPDAPPHLTAIIEQAMHRDPSQRMPNAQQLHTALEQVALVAGAESAGGAEASAGSATPDGPTASGSVPDVSGPEAMASGAFRAMAGDPGRDRVRDDWDAGLAAMSPSARQLQSDQVVDGESPRGPSSGDRPDDAGGPEATATSPTTDFGPRPMPPIEVEEPGRAWWMVALLVAVVVVPLGVAAWALWSWNTGEQADPAGRDDADPTATASAVAPTAGSGTAVAVPPVLGTAPVPSDTRSAATSTATASPSSLDPGNMEPRVAAPLCDDVAEPGADELVGDVDGRGCSLPVQVVPGEDVTTLRLPDAAGQIAGSYELDGPPLHIVLGDWDGDGSDTPAVIVDAVGTVFGFSSWQAGRADEIDEPIGAGTPAVVTHPTGIDHVVASDAP